MRTFDKVRSEPLMRMRGELATLSPEARERLNAIIDGSSARRTATLLGCSDATISILREPYGTASPKTVERLTRRLEELAL
jgi:FixJ family two-component response regulator